MSLFKLYEKYCSDKALSDFNSLKDLDKLLENFVNDPFWAKELNSLETLVPCSTLLEDANSKQSIQAFIALRVLSHIVGPVLVYTLLTKLDSKDIIGSWKDKLGFNSNNELLVDSFESSKILRNIIELSALKLNSNITLNQDSYKTALDFDANKLSFGLLQHIKIAKYVALADSPAKERHNSIYRQLEQSFKQVKLQKGVLFIKSDCKMFYDDQGNRFINKKPYHQNVSVGYPSFTLCDAINKYKCDLLKLDLNELSSQQLLLSQTQKAIRKHTNNIMLTLNAPVKEHLNILNFSFDELMLPLVNLIKLINSMNELNPNLKPLVQFDSTMPLELVLTFNA